MKSSEIRKKFLEFFEAKGHKRLPGSSLIPSDPTVLLTLAGMLQFKPIFLGQEKPQHKRATTVQKCIRMIDVERVGHTPRHHTFFEMLGNFSFGDYFKKEAIQFAWELLVKELKLPVTRLKIAIYEQDEEAFEIWRNSIGLPKEIIYRLGEDNNFWSAGPTGPCGPCSEIYYDLGEEHGCGKPDCRPGCDCDRFLEIWNLVFIQYNRNEKGELLPLKQKGIDTGMGLERIASVLQGVNDNYETDLFTPLLKKLMTMGAQGNAHSTSMRIVADHIRAITHLISDGVLPENAGRGYVLRRLIRRSIRHGRALGIRGSFMVELAREVILQMEEAYPLLREKADLIFAALREEEAGFLATLDHGMKLFAELETLHAEDRRLQGEEAFRLHDTFGFPIELTVELAAESGYQVDVAGFEKEMEKQRERARQGGTTSDKKKELATLELSRIKPTFFTGYESDMEEAKIVALFPEKQIAVLEKTPFYGESGGQVGDTGIFAWNKKEIRVINTFISPKGVILHQLETTEGLKNGMKIKAQIDVSRRKTIAAHHTATHLLHKVLREMLGEHVKQAGSYVGPDKLRFDFNHFRAMGLEEIEKVEQLVNRKISEKIKVEVLQKTYMEAVTMGAMALFGEKYGDKVRVLKIGDYSLELCGGTHVKNTCEIAFFKIISEGALGSGIRRIEALAGEPSRVFVIYRAKSLHDEIDAKIRKYRSLQTEKERLGGTKATDSNIFEIEVTEIERLNHAVDNQDSTNVNKFIDHLCGRVEWLTERIAKTEKEIEALKEKNVKGEIENYLKEIKEISGKKVLFKQFKAMNMGLLRSLSDSLQGQLKSCILVMTNTEELRVNFLITVTPDLIAAGVSAQVLAAKLAEVMEGKSGGREGKAEGGGKDTGRLLEGFSQIESLLA